MRYLVLEVRGSVAEDRRGHLTHLPVGSLGIEVQQRYHHIQNEVFLELLVNLQLLFVELFLRQECALVLGDLLDELLLNFEQRLQGNEIALLLKFVEEAGKDVPVVLAIYNLLEQASEIVDDGILFLALKLLQNSWSEHNLRLLVDDRLQGLQAQEPEIRIWLLHEFLYEYLHSHVIQIVRCTGRLGLWLIWFVSVQMEY